MSEEDFEVGRCFGQCNPLWGRGVVRINRHLQSSVLDFERLDTTVVYTSAGLETIEHNVQPAHLLLSSGYQPIDETLFNKLRAMTRAVNAAAKARMAETWKVVDCPAASSPSPIPLHVGAVAAAKSDTSFSLIRVLGFVPYLPKVQVDHFTIASGLVREETTLSVKQISLDAYRLVPESAFDALQKLWESTTLAVNDLLRQYGLIKEETTSEDYAKDYAREMTTLLNGVYDVVDVHK